MMNGYQERHTIGNSCPAHTHEEAKITVPVAVRAWSEMGEVCIKCKGPAVVVRNSDNAPGVPGNISKFTVSQRIHVDIPLAFTAQADVGEGHVLYNSSERREPHCEDTCD